MGKTGCQQQWCSQALTFQGLRQHVCRTVLHQALNDLVFISSSSSTCMCLIKAVCFSMSQILYVISGENTKKKKKAKTQQQSCSHSREVHSVSRKVTPDTRGSRGG